ncbi:hypothetical protein TNCV_2907471 [Trichonephila clavipes]|nr:hypothetical protein TNCV_2907471 [Trichonephila clavipes]
MANNQSVRRHLDAFTRGRIIGKLEEGRSVTSVAAEFELLTASFHDFGDNFKRESRNHPRTSLKGTGMELKFLKVPDSQCADYLIGALPSDIATLIAGELDDEAQDYVHVKKMLLRRFKLSAEKFRQLFRQHKKVQEST